MQAFDDGVRRQQVGSYVAMSCTVETGKLVELASAADRRGALQEEAVRRAAGYVLTTRRMEADALEPPPTRSIVRRNSTRHAWLDRSNATFGGG